MFCSKLFELHCSLRCEMQMSSSQCWGWHWCYWCTCGITHLFTSWHPQTEQGTDQETDNRQQLFILPTGKQLSLKLQPVFQGTNSSTHKPYKVKSPCKFVTYINKFDANAVLYTSILKFFCGVSERDQLLCIQLLLQQRVQETYNLPLICN